MTSYVSAQYTCTMLHVISNAKYHLFSTMYCIIQVLKCQELSRIGLDIASIVYTFIIISTSSDGRATIWQLFMSPHFHQNLLPAANLDMDTLDIVFRQISTILEDFVAIVYGLRGSL